MAAVVTSIATSIGGETTQQRWNRLANAWQIFTRIAMDAADAEARARGYVKQAAGLCGRMCGPAVMRAYANAVDTHNTLRAQSRDAQQRADAVYHEMMLAHGAYLDEMRRRGAT